MSAASIALSTFALTFGFAVLATYLRGLLPAPHVSKESQDVVRLGMGLVATMTALLLGLVTASARGTFDETDSVIRGSAVTILSLDRALARYGPETRPIRDELKRLVRFRYDNTWGRDAEGGLGKIQPTAVVDEFGNRLLRLAPQDDAQRWLKNEALRLSDEVMKTRWRILESGSDLPRTFLAVVVFWLTATFASFGLFAPRNATVMAVFFIAAVSVAAAVFLIVELDGPYDGFLMVSGEPLRFALENLGQ